MGGYSLRAQGTGGPQPSPQHDAENIREYLCHPGTRWLSDRPHVDRCRFDVFCRFHVDLVYERVDSLGASDVQEYSCSFSKWSRLTCRQKPRSRHLVQDKLGAALPPSPDRKRSDSQVTQRNGVSQRSPCGARTPVTSWARDTAIIAGHLMEVENPASKDQESVYREVLVGNMISYGNLQHGAITMKHPGFSWCPPDIFRMPRGDTTHDLLRSQKGYL